ncbi:MAG TPA: [acyl-carrier-protein] S-malonyltransferase [candidate division Zixibacteria bacterium]|nr:[acyl-carrier-protein] S-malonyltransferase [candidate division Zixibacteria bacterium]
MGKTAFIFPGQASQYVGMAKDFYDSSPEVRKLYERASEILGYDLADVSFNGPIEKLTQTAYTQPAILVHSLAVLRDMGDDYGEVEFAAGHSLGEYSALAFAGVLTFEDAVLAVRERSRAMQAACDAAEGTMAALIGCEGENLDNLVQGASKAGIIQPANFNSPGQVAVSGERRAIEKAIEIAKDYGARKAIPLQVGGAFHSPLMEPAREKVAEVLNQMQFNDSRIAVVTNVEARGETDSDHLRELLIRQITSPVLWKQSVEYMVENGVERFIEIGPGKVLSGLVKRTVRSADIGNIDTVEDLKKFKEFVSA